MRNPAKQQTRAHGEKCVTHSARTKHRDLLDALGSGIFACLRFVVMFTTLEASLCSPRYHQYTHSNSHAIQLQPLSQQ